jgi:hypothetical protein
MTDPSGDQEQVSDPDEWESWPGDVVDESISDTFNPCIISCRSPLYVLSPPPLIQAEIGSSGGTSLTLSNFMSGMRIVTQLLVDRAIEDTKATISGVTFGAKMKSLEIGGTFSVTFGFSTEDQYEETMLRERLKGLQENPIDVGLGELLVEMEFQKRTPSPPELPPDLGPNQLYGIGPSAFVRKAARIEQQAHKQILKYKYPKWLHEVTLELIPGVIVRTDAFRLTKKGAEVLIIKPDTPTGQIAAWRRAALVRDAGYKPIIELYDPTSPAWKPSSPTYIPFHCCPVKTRIESAGSRYR